VEALHHLGDHIHLWPRFEASCAIGPLASLHVQMHLHLLYRARITAFLTGVKNGKSEDMYSRGTGSAPFCGKWLHIVA